MCILDLETGGVGGSLSDTAFDVCMIFRFSGKCCHSTRTAVAYALLSFRRKKGPDMLTWAAVSDLTKMQVKSDIQYAIIQIHVFILDLEKQTVARCRIQEQHDTSGV